jgi:hypothetical protein
VKHDRTGQVTTPAFPYVHRDLAPVDASRREQLARWITSKENQYFAKSYVNRLWGYLFGRGIIEPIDDIRAGNPPTNPELLDGKSRVYQHSIATNQWNADDELNNSRAIPRRLPAETLFDAIHLATGATPRLPGVPVGFRAAELPDAGVSLPFLEDFGRPVRESACECERSSGMVLGPIMKLVNGPTVADAINDPNNALVDLEKSEPDDRKAISELFLRFLARQPTEESSGSVSKPCTPRAKAMPPSRPNSPSTRSRCQPNKPSGKRDLRARRPGHRWRSSDSNPPPAQRPRSSKTMWCSSKGIRRRMCIV